MDGTAGTLRGLTTSVRAYRPYRTKERRRQVILHGLSESRANVRRMMTRGLLFLLAAIGVITAGVGCGGSAGVLNQTCDWSDPSCPIYTATPAPTPVPSCTYPSGTQPQMVYPKPGASGVSDEFNVQGIVLADRSAANYDTASAFYMAWLGPETTANAFEGDTTPVILSTFYPIDAAQVPQPSAAPAFANPVYEASSTPNGGMVNPIEPHTHYFVYLQRLWSDLSGNQCNAVGPVGDFTTE